MYEIINQLCKERKISITKLCEMVTNSSGNLATWKKGYMRSDYLQKIADYFGVSVDYLLGRTENPNLSSINDSNNGIINNSSVNNSNQTIGLNPLTTDETAVQLLEAFQKLDIFGKAEVMNLIVKLSQKAG